MTAGFKSESPAGFVGIRSLDRIDRSSRGGFPLMTAGLEFVPENRSGAGIRFWERKG